MAEKNPIIEAFYDEITGTVSYVVYDHIGGSAAIIDPVLTYAPNSGRTNTLLAQTLIEYVSQQNLKVEWILETHAHADHLSAAQWVKNEIGGKVSIGESICQVQAIFAKLFNLGEGFPVDGSQFDYLFKDQETFSIGCLQAKALHVPGHTPADMAYQIGNAIFVGDTLFMPDVGTARCDFPGGNVTTLYHSIQKLLQFPPDTLLYMCHDYPPTSRGPAWVSTVAQQKEHNIHVHDGISCEQFIEFRTKRDATLELPRLILPSIQVNIRAGFFPEVEDNGVHYLKIPLNQV